ncbi:MAG: MarR family transcriptional regulator [Bacillales bacterium]|jgi:DNA-binding MarR family transcriptional regulator|nr:MarR family transcriptional regulator [Bacillales bacterium]
MDKIQKILEVEKLMRNIFRIVKSDLSNLFKDDISNNEFIILKILSENSSLKLSDISKLLNVSKAHLTAVTDTLDSNNLILRDRSTKDRRVMNLSITPKGLETLKRLEQIKTDYFINKFKSFTTEELDTLTYMLEKMYDTKNK